MRILLVSRPSLLGKVAAAQIASNLGEALRAPALGLAQLERIEDCLAARDAVVSRPRFPNGPRCLSSCVF